MQAYCMVQADYILKWYHVRWIQSTQGCNHVCGSCTCSTVAPPVMWSLRWASRLLYAVVLRLDTKCWCHPLMRDHLFVVTIFSSTRHGRHIGGQRHCIVMSWCPECQHSVKVIVTIMHCVVPTTTAPLCPVTRTDLNTYLLYLCTSSERPCPPLPEKWSCKSW